MIKKCKVVLRNSINMVVVFDGVEIQMPTDNDKSSMVFIKNDNGLYSVVTESEYDKSLKVTKNKSKKEIVFEDKTSDDSELN